VRSGARLPRAGRSRPIRRHPWSRGIVLFAI